MPQSIISQFSRAYNEPIETNRRVATATVRDAIPSTVRWEGMLVYVTADQQTYELKGGIDNTNWTTYNRVSDAPADGGYYARKDGAWAEILTSDNGLSGIVLKGSTGGTYTVGAQNWKWARAGKNVTFAILLSSISGTAPTGQLIVDISGITMPAMGENHLFNAQIDNAGVFAYYSLLGANDSFNDQILFKYRNTNSGNSLIADDIDFTGGGIITLTGSYVALN